MCAIALVFVRAACLGGSLLAACGCGGDKLVLGGGGTSKCIPGLYEGSYTCATDAGLAFSLASLSITLEGDRGGPHLTVGPGTTLAGTESGSAFTAPITGSVDCSSAAFMATVGNVTVTTAGTPIATVYEMSVMTAEYDGDAAPPALVGGVWTLPQSELGPAQTCTWYARLQQ